MPRRRLTGRLDIRGRYRELMDDSHFRFPRNLTINHPIEWYLDGHLRTKPLVALHAYGKLAERMLYYVRHGRRGQDGAERTVVEFFAATRRAMQNVLSTYRLDKGIGRAGRESVAKTVDVLRAMASAANDAIGDASESCECPACAGASLHKSDAELLEAILYERSRAGVIPPTSILFRASAVDKLPHAVV